MQIHNLYRCMDVYVHTYIHVYVHTCIHVYIYTYIHTQLNACLLQREAAQLEETLRATQERLMQVLRHIRFSPDAKET